MRRAPFVCGLLLLTCSPLIAADATALPAPLLEWKPGLDLLHGSCTDEALAWFEQRRAARPEDPCGSYFAALIYTSFDVDGLLHDQEKERGRELLEVGIQTGQRRLQADPRDGAARYCLAALHGLRAAERLERSKYVAAAFDARRARGIMLDLLEERPDCIDCRFWVGSYDYFADVLPGAIKFFRTLMFFPRGDRERGLQTLNDVSRRGSLDRYNALWVLHAVYERMEDDPQLALETIERARAVYPDNVDADLMLGWNHAMRNQPADRARGIELHLEALEQAGSFGGSCRARVESRIKLSLARLYLRDLQPEAAIQLLRPLLPAARGQVERDLRSGQVMARALNHAGRHAEARVILDGLRSRHPGLEQLEAIERTVLAFDESASRTFHEVLKLWRAGRVGQATEASAAFDGLRDAGHAAGLTHFGEASMYLDLGHASLAERHFRLATEAGIERPALLLPLAFIRLGNLLDLRQKRREAKAFYRKASGSAAEHPWLREAAKHYLKEPYGGGDGVQYP